jgi:hypothetical protein
MDDCTRIIRFRQEDQVRRLGLGDPLGAQVQLVGVSGDMEAGRSIGEIDKTGAVHAGHADAI